MVPIDYSTLNCKLNFSRCSRLFTLSLSSVVTCVFLHRSSPLQTTDITLCPAEPRPHQDATHPRAPSIGMSLCLLDAGKQKSHHESVQHRVISTVTTECMMGRPSLLSMYGLVETVLTNTILRSKDNLAPRSLAYSLFIQIRVCTRVKNKSSESSELVCEARLIIQYL